MRTPPEKIEALRRLGLFKRKGRPRQECVFIVRRGKVCSIPSEVFHIKVSHFENWLKTEGSKRLLPTYPVRGHRGGRAWNLSSKHRRVPPARQKTIWMTYPLNTSGIPIGRGRRSKWWDRWGPGGLRGCIHRRLAWTEMCFGHEDYTNEKMYEYWDDWYDRCYDDWPGEETSDGVVWSTPGWSVTFLDLMR